MSVSAEGISSYTHTHSLGGQPLHKREEGSGVMTIRQLFQCLYKTCCHEMFVQNGTREDLAPGWSERTVGTAPTNY